MFITTIIEYRTIMISDSVKGVEMYIKNCNEYAMVCYNRSTNSYYAPSPEDGNYDDMPDKLYFGPWCTCWVNGKPSSVCKPSVLLLDYYNMKR